MSTANEILARELAQDAVTVRPPAPIVQQLHDSLYAQGIVLAADGYWHAERGVFLDLAAWWKRSNRQIGRVVSDAHPLDGGTFPPISILPESRVWLFHTYIGPALRNLTALDRERHWRHADAFMKRLGQLEASWLRGRAQHQQELAAEALNDERLEQADAHLQAATLLTSDADAAAMLGRQYGWHDPVGSFKCYVCGGMDEQTADGMWACQNCGRTRGPLPMGVR